jgi:hypothetical protein
MENEEFLKRIEFLAIVQTTMIANGINCSNQEELKDRFRHDYSGLGVKNLMRDAVRASRFIPKEKSFWEAAEEFLLSFLSKFSDSWSSEERQANFPEWIPPGFEK